SARAAALDRWVANNGGDERTWPISFTFSDMDLGAVSVFHMPRQLWVALCSGVFLAIGLAVALISVSRAFVCVVFVLALAGLLGIYWALPGWIPPVAMGCQPGLVVLVTVLIAVWMWRERYRRQVVFMPGFRRLKSESSLVKDRGSQRGGNDRRVGEQGADGRHGNEQRSRDIIPSDAAIAAADSSAQAAST